MHNSPTCLVQLIACLAPDKLAVPGNLVQYILPEAFGYEPGKRSQINSYTLDKYSKH
jgi:hypothetical protein